MLSKFYKTLFALTVVISPILAGAQLTQTDRILSKAYGLIVQIVVPMVFTLALLFFFWGVVKYIRSEGQGKEDGKRIMIWGVVALFVMSSIWGLVYFIRNELGVNNNSNIPIPTIGGQTGMSNEDYWDSQSP
jgi:hypothetical protein